MPPDFEAFACRHQHREKPRARGWLVLFALLVAPGLRAGELGALLEASPALPFATEFDCVNAFDLFATFASLHCAASRPAGDTAGDTARIDRALSRLQRLGLLSAAERTGADVQFCPLISGTGLVPAVGRILLDDAFRTTSEELLAEVLLHEFVHVRQFERLGADGFKCTYVREMTRCGGCQDQGHPLEREAYDQQDRARVMLDSGRGGVARH